MLERVLVGVDGSTQAAGAAAWAASLAQDLGARLVVASVWAPSRAELPEDEARGERDHTYLLLQESWSQPARAIVDRVELVLLDGDSPDVLLDAADRIDADLVVVGTRGRGGFAGLRVGSFSDYVTHRTIRPIAVIPADAKTGVGRVVLGLDGSESDLWVLGSCIALAEPLGAHVIAVHAHGPHRNWLGSPPDDWEVRARAALDDWTAPLRDAGVTVDTRLVETDHAADALLDVAAEVNADAIVIGTRDFSGYRLLRLGGVTMALVHHSDRPVIIVPPPE